MDILNANTDGKFAWQLSTYARGACQLQSDAEVVCTPSAQATQSYLLTGRAPSVRGRPAFWAGLAAHPKDSVAWQYAPGAWAVLVDGKSAAQPSTAVLRIARGVIFGASSQPIEFAAQLGKVPATWRISSVNFSQVSGTDVAYQYWFTAIGSKQIDLPFVTVSLSRFSCYFYPDGQSAHRVINGYHVVVNTIAAVRGHPTTYQVCVPGADGLYIFLSVDGGQPVIQPVTLFRHMKLLGTNPAGWVTTPTS